MTICCWWHVWATEFLHLSFTQPNNCNTFVCKCVCVRVFFFFFILSRAHKNAILSFHRKPTKITSVFDCNFSNQSFAFLFPFYPLYLSSCCKMLWICLCKWYVHNAFYSFLTAPTKSLTSMRCTAGCCCFFQFNCIYDAAAFVSQWSYSMFTFDRRR